MYLALDRVRLLAAIALFSLLLTACAPGASAGGAPYGYGSGTPPTSTVPLAAAPSSTPGPQATSADPNAQRYSIVSADSKATYRAHQQVFVADIAPAVDGSTNDVSGVIFFDPQHPSRSQVGPITVRLDALKSGIDLRDQRLKGEFLESSKFPTGTFKATRLENLPDTPYADGQELRFKIDGDLTLHGVTRPVSFDATGKAMGGKLTASATSTIMMSDFGIQLPDLANFVKAENAVGLDLSITAQRA